MLLIVIPHVLLEGGAYILAGIAGAVISDDVISESKELRKFIFSLIGVVAVFFFLNYLFSFFLYGSVLTVLRIVFFLGLLYLLKLVFVDKKHKEVFTYNFWLFVVALLVFIVGALVETGVLSFSGLLNQYYMASMMFFM